MCNGHADTCDIQDPTNTNILVCRCQHNTCGNKCETCCPGYQQKAWRQSKSYKLFVCEGTLDKSLFSLLKSIFQNVIVSVTATIVSTMRRLTDNISLSIFMATMKEEVFASTVNTTQRE